MDRTMLNIKILYGKMGKAEKRIADWLMENPTDMIHLSIVDLAERCGCGEATVVRFARRLGFSGYQDMKISIAQESGVTPVSAVVEAADSTAEIFDKVCNDIYYALEKTKSVLEAGALEAACKCILSASRIIIFGLGSSASIAKDAEHKLLRAGLSAVAYSDNHMQVIAASHLTEGDVVLAISHSGHTREIIDACEIAKKKGAAVISITNTGKSPLQACSDTVLYISSDEARYNMLALNARIAQLAIVNVIYYYAILHSRDGESQMIKKEARSPRAKKP